MVEKKKLELSLGRYFKTEQLGFLTRWSAIAKQSRGALPGQMIAREIYKSIREDLRPKVKPHDSGLDVKSIALAKIETYRVQIEREQKAQELEQAKSLLSLLDDFRAELKTKITGLTGDGTTVGQRRADELAAVRERAERRAS